MATEIIMPKAGMSMEEGTIVRWYKEVGEEVSAGEPLLEIVTDKVNMEVEAEVSGTLLEIIGQEDQVLPVFTVIGYIGEKGAKAQKAQKVEAVGSSKEKIRATPAARKEARQKNLDLAAIQGTGPKSRVQKQDVLDYQGESQKTLSPHARRLAEKYQINIKDVTGTGHKGKIMARDIFSWQNSDTSKPVSENTNNYTETPRTHVERTIAQRMIESDQTSPTFSLQIEVDMKEAKALLEKEKKKNSAQAGKSTITDLLLMTCAQALMEHKSINASLRGNNIRSYDHANIALAIGLEDGLRVPVIANVEELSLAEIAGKRAALVHKAQSGKLSPDDSQGSTFTISNLGMYGISSFTSIINQPNAAILSVGAIKDTVVYLDGGITVRPMMNMTLTLDHRIADGVKGAKFLQSLKSYLENPQK